MFNHFSICFFLLNILSFNISMANNPSPSPCMGTRQAQASVRVNKLYWVKDETNYKLNSDLVCKTKTTLSVLPGSAGNCTYPVIADCPVMMDGNQHRVRVSGLIYFSERPEGLHKNFVAAYHLDRNSTEVRTGEASSVDIHSLDLNLKRIGLTLQSKLDSPISGKTMRDGLNIDVEFEDSDAP